MLLCWTYKDGKLLDVRFRNKYIWIQMITHIGWNFRKFEIVLFLNVFLKNESNCIQQNFLRQILCWTYDGISYVLLLIKFFVTFPTLKDGNYLTENNLSWSVFTLSVIRIKCFITIYYHLIIIYNLCHY